MNLLIKYQKSKNININKKRKKRRISRKRKNYTAEFKTKIVLELLGSDKSLNEIASKYEILPKSLSDWKKQFLSNASLAFDKSSVVKEYKEKINELEKQGDTLVKKAGTLTI